MGDGGGWGTSGADGTIAIPLSLPRPAGAETPFSGLQVEVKHFPCPGHCLRAWQRSLCPSGQRSTVASGGTSSQNLSPCGGLLGLCSCP